MSTKEEMLAKKKWAVYGITKDREKFGYKIPEILKKRGYEVIGINKKYAGEQILGVDVYASLADVQGEIECIDVVVNPTIAKKVVEEAIQKGIKYIWFQPGTYDSQVIDMVKKASISYVDNDCVYKVLS